MLLAKKNFEFQARVHKCHFGNFSISKKPIFSEKNNFKKIFKEFFFEEMDFLDFFFVNFLKKKILLKK